MDNVLRLPFVVMLRSPVPGLLVVGSAGPRPYNRNPMKQSQTSAVAVAQDASQAQHNDADLPAGDSPPRPLWPLVVGVSVWILWIGFLLAMMVIRLRTSPV